MHSCAWLICATGLVLAGCAVGGTEQTSDAGDNDIGVLLDADVPLDAPASDSGVDASFVDASGVDAGDVDAGRSCSAITSADLGLWVFDHAPITSPSMRATLFSFATMHGVRTLYVDATGIASTSSPVRMGMAEFVAAAHVACLNIEFLFSNEHYIDPDDGNSSTVDRSSFYAQIDGVNNFIAVNPDARPDAVHLYLRPYELPTFVSNPSFAYNNFLDVVTEAQVRMGSIPLNVDIPYWYYTTTITRSGMNKAMHIWITDLVPTVTIMAFHDDPSMAVSYASMELNYAATTGKHAIIALDAQCEDTSPRVSYWEEGATAIHAALDYVYAMDSSNAAFAGRAVRDYEHYRLLSDDPGSPPTCPETGL